MEIDAPFPTLIDRLAAAGETLSDAEKRARLADEVERVRGAMAEMLVRLNDGTACRLPPDQQDVFDRIADPYLAANRVSHAYSRIVLLEQRVGESAETRAKREAEEAAERERQALAAAERERPRTPEEITEYRVRRSAKLAYRDAFPSLHKYEREFLLKDIFDEFDDFGDYRGDPVDILAAICETLARDPAAALAEIPYFQNSVGEPADEGERLTARCKAWAESCLDWIDALDAPIEAEAPPELAQGPPVAA
jgi:hypothetical protein